MRLSPHVTKPAPSVSFSMAGGGVPLETPVGYGLAGSSGRRAETRSGDSAEEYSAGPGGGTTLGEGHRWRHRLSSRLGDGRRALPLVSANPSLSCAHFPWPARTLEEGT